MMNRLGNVARRPGGFTLVELLVVVAVIALLLGVILGVGPRILEGQKVSSTKAILGAMDRALDEYIEVSGGPPPYNPELYQGIPGGGLGDGEAGPTLLTGPLGEDEQYDGDVRHVPAGIFSVQAAGVGASDAIIRGLPASNVVSVRCEVAVDPSEPSSTDGQSVLAANVLDAWGTGPGGWAYPYPVFGATPKTGPGLIWYVHPRNRLAQDLYGQCVNKRPYFFSAGPDRIYGTSTQFRNPQGGAPLGTRNLEAVPTAIEGLKDNIYSYPVGPAVLDQEFGQTIR